MIFFCFVRKDRRVSHFLLQQNLAILDIVSYSVLAIEEYRYCIDHTCIGFSKKWEWHGTHLDFGSEFIFAWFLCGESRSVGHLMMKVILFNIPFMEKHAMHYLYHEIFFLKKIIYFDSIWNENCRISFVGVPGRNNFWSLCCFGKLESKWLWPMQVVWCSLCRW